MSQEIEELVVRLTKLVRLSGSNNHHEASLAYARAQETLEKYGTKHELCNEGFLALLKQKEAEWKANHKPSVSGRYDFKNDTISTILFFVDIAFDEICDRWRTARHRFHPPAYGDMAAWMAVTKKGIASLVKLADRSGRRIDETTGHTNKAA